MHAEILQRLHGWTNAGKRRHADILDEDVLRCSGAALHAVKHDDVGSGLDRKRRIVIRPRAADLDVDRLFPIRDLAQFHDLDFEIVRTGPVRMTAGRALVDALREIAHVGDAIGDLLAEEHASAARFGSLSHDHFDRIGATQIFRVHAVTRGEILIDQRLRMAAFFIRHAAVTRRGRRACKRCTPAKRFLGVARERAEAHAGNRDRGLQRDRLLGMSAAENDSRIALLAIAFERIARDRRAEEQ